MVAPAETSQCSNAMYANDWIWSNVNGWTGTQSSACNGYYNGAGFDLVAGY
jgi:hypothetical protein